MDERIENLNREWNPRPEGKPITDEERAKAVAGMDAYSKLSVEQKILHDSRLGSFEEVKKAKEAGTWPFEFTVKDVYRRVYDQFVTSPNLNEKPPTVEEFYSIISGEKTIEEVKSARLEAKKAIEKLAGQNNLDWPFGSTKA